MFSALPGSPLLPWLVAFSATAAAAALWARARRRKAERDRALGTVGKMAELAGVLAARVDLEGRWLAVPGGLCDLLGRGERDLLHQRVADCLHPGDQDRVLAHCREVLEGKRGSLDLEVRVLRPDGSERWMEVDGTLDPGGGGTPRHFEVLIRDISGAKAVAQALRDSEEKFRTLSENINCGVFLYTDVFHYVNPGMEVIVGYQAEELLGQPFWKPVHPDEQEMVHQRGEARRRGEAVPNRYLMKLLHKDGRTVYVDFIARAVTLGGKVFGLGTAFDVTDRVHAAEERLRLERQVLEAQKLESLGLLAGGIAHDFNNLLTVVLGNASIIVEESEPGDLIHACAKTVADACRRASDLTKQMLAYSGRSRFEAEALDLNVAVMGISTLLESSLSKLVEVRYELGKDLPGLEGDHAQLQQVILNLVTNAAEAIGEACGTVWIRTGLERLDEEQIASGFPGQELAPGPYLFLEVEDTGVGMDAATQARIFEPFYSTKGLGRGLGLAAMQGIVRGHRGGIRICSSPGEGTAFRIVLPAVGPVAPAAEPEPPPEATVRKGTGLVLLVEDEGEIREMAALALRRAGYEVLEAADGRSAVEAFRARRDDLRAVVLDLVMPTMGGAAALAEMEVISQRVPVILCSGFQGDSAGPGLAGRPFLQKPYTTAQLVEKVQAAAE